ncbi:MAG: (d)CMP kinase [Aureliella sp.]
MPQNSSDENRTSPGVVIAIDGPAGAGKSTVAKALSDRLGFDFLDTGAMYRCVTLAILRSGVDPEDADSVAKIASGLDIELRGETVLMGGDDVSREIRTPEVAGSIGKIADNVKVRKTLTELQRRWTRGRCVVTEGRDQGSEVFFDSPCKFYLYASSEERARRRRVELSSRGIDMTLEEVREQQDRRDAADMSRPVGALRRAEDAQEFCTDGLELQQVVVQLEGIVRERLQAIGCEMKAATQSEHSDSQGNAGNG